MSVVGFDQLSIKMSTEELVSEWWEDPLGVELWLASQEKALIKKGLLAGKEFLKIAVFWDGIADAEGTSR